MFLKFLLIFLYLKSLECSNTKQNALKYLSKYGYINSFGPKSHQTRLLQQYQDNSFEKSLKEFQSFAGIPKTGKLDELTLKMMEKPRCGMKDLVKSKKLLKYSISKWQKKNLTFRITKYPKILSNNEDIDETIQNAFNLWSKYTDLTFKPIINYPDIEIRFENGIHGDGDDFDGPGGVLAHAALPLDGGDVHFDDSEEWVIRTTDDGINLYEVAAHEFGHALGLEHSEINNALMGPFYKGLLHNFDLHQDDINNIQKLYGEKSKSIEESVFPNVPKDLSSYKKYFGFLFFTKYNSN